MKKKNIIIYGIIIVLALVSIVGITYGWQDVIRVKVKQSDASAKYLYQNRRIRKLYLSCYFLQGIA